MIFRNCRSALKPDAPVAPRVQAVIAGRLDRLSQPAATLARRPLVERPLGSREHALILDRVLDHRAGIRPVHLRCLHEAHELFGRRRELRRNWQRRRGADQDE